MNEHAIFRYGRSQNLGQSVNQSFESEYGWI